MKIGVLALFLPLSVLAAGGDEIYKQHCALCHDSGATLAPRVGQPAEWLQRVEKGRAGLLRSAREGVSGTAMQPRAGFPELSNDDLAAALDYMLSTLGLSIRPVAEEKVVQRPPPVALARVDDTTLVANVAEAVRQRIAPRAKLEGARVAGVTVEARQGRVALRGMVDSSRLIREAEDAALGVAGVVEVDNHLVGADLFEHD